LVESFALDAFFLNPGPTSRKGFVTFTKLRILESLTPSSDPTAFPTCGFSPTIRVDWSLYPIEVNIFPFYLDYLPKKKMFHINPLFLFRGLSPRFLFRHKFDFLISGCGWNFPLSGIVSRVPRNG